MASGVGVGGSTQTSVIAMARALHDTVVQRLCGLSLLLEPEWSEADVRQDLCRHEIATALQELRAALDTCLAPETLAERCTPTPEEELAALRESHPGVAVTHRGLRHIGVLDTAARSLVDATIAEGLRNAHKHACPRNVAALVEMDGAVLTLRIRNDGRRPRGRRDRPEGTDMGLRLLAMEASLHGGTVHSGALDLTTWELRLDLPVETV